MSLRCNREHWEWRKNYVEAYDSEPRQEAGFEFEASHKRKQLVVWEIKKGKELWSGFTSYQ